MYCPIEIDAAKLLSLHPHTTTQRRPARAAGIGSGFRRTLGVRVRVGLRGVRLLIISFVGLPFVWRGMQGVVGLRLYVWVVRVRQWDVCVGDLRFE